MTDREIMQQALEALEYPGPSWPESRERAAQALRAAIAEAEKQEPLGYWNAVEGWVELPEETHKPVAWVYPEALEAFRQGKPWTAYGADGKGPNSDGVERISLYTTPPTAQRQWVGLTEKDFSAINQSCLTKLQAATSAESILKEKNT